MPNWTHNTIEFKTLDDFNIIVAEIMSGDEDGDFEFNKLVPEPIKIENCPEDYRFEDSEESQLELDMDRPWFNWYAWHCKFWGTKWDACDSSADSEDLSIYFATAWSAPYPIFEALAFKYPKIPFEVTSYYEDGGGTKFVYKGDKSKLEITDFETDTEEMDDNETED